MATSPAPLLDVLDALDPERAAFVALLRGLDASAWRAPTECPAYDVQGVATHVLGDDLSLLSRQRDEAPNGLLARWGPGEGFRSVLDRFNDRWVEAAAFLSPVLVTELLVLTGRWTAEWYASVDPAAPGEPVGFFAADGPSPWWQVSAREYVERWVHHHQVRRAVGEPDLDDDAILRPAVAACVRGVAAHLPDLGRPAGTTVEVAVDGLAAWALVRDGARWVVHDGRPADAAARLRLARGDATPVFSRGASGEEVRSAVAVEGDPALAEAVMAPLVALARG